MKAYTYGFCFYTQLNQETDLRIPRTPPSPPAAVSPNPKPAKRYRKMTRTECEAFDLRVLTSPKYNPPKHRYEGWRSEEEPPTEEEELPKENSKGSDTTRTTVPSDPPATSFDQRQWDNLLLTSKAMKTQDEMDDLD